MTPPTAAAPAPTLPGTPNVPAVLSGLIAAHDLILLLHEGGRIREVRSAHDAPLAEATRGWIGLAWRDAAVAEHRSRVDDLLQEAGRIGAAGRRLILHTAGPGAVLPLTCTVVRLDGVLLVLARDDRELGALQARITEAQQLLHGAARRAAHLEARQRTLLDLGSGALLLVDAASRRVLEVNDAAAELLGQPVGRLVGRTLAAALEVKAEATVREFLGTAPPAGGTEELVVERVPPRGRLRLTAAHLARDTGGVLVVRAADESADGGRGPGREPGAGEILGALPDAVVVTDAQGRVVTANNAFHHLTGIGPGARAAGEGLQRWVGRPGADVPRVLQELERHGSVHLLETVVESDRGTRCEVELEAGPLDTPAGRRWVFSLRAIAHRLPRRPKEGTALAHAVSELTSQVGKRALKELVRDTAVALERQFIEAALAATRGNRTAAAALLGVSRQSLYVKLRQYGLGDEPSAPVPAHPTRRRKPRHRRPRL